MIDTHCHLNLSPLLENYETHVQKALAAGVAQMVVVGVNIETSKQAISLAETHPDHIWAAIGIHPEEVGVSWESGSTSETDESLKKLLQSGNVKAIGECGLDYTGTSDHDAQKELFLLQAKLALSHDLPLIIHCRNTRRIDEVVSYDAYADLLKLLREIQQKAGKYPRFILHCVSGSTAYVKEALDMGAYISFAGNVTYPNAQAIRDLLDITPLDRLLVETDAPFLSPQSKRGTQNEPANVMKTAMFITEFLGKSIEEIDNITTQNADSLFNA